MNIKTIRFLGIIGAVLLAASACASGSTPAPVVGRPAPDFALRTLDGQTVSLGDFKGKPVLLNFWATWCPPCQSEMPYMQQVHDAWTPKGLVMLNVDIGETPDVIRSFLAQRKLALTVPMDTNQSVSDAYSVTAIPTTFFIDASGVIRQKMVGAFPSEATIESQLPSIMR